MVFKILYFSSNCKISYREPIVFIFKDFFISLIKTIDRIYNHSHYDSLSFVRNERFIEVQIVVLK